MRQNAVSTAMVGGLLGTLAQTLMVYGIIPMLRGQAIDMASLLGGSCTLGLLSHFVSGGVLFLIVLLFLAPKNQQRDATQAALLA